MLQTAYFGLSFSLSYLTFPGPQTYYYLDVDDHPPLLFLPQLVLKFLTHGTVLFPFNILNGKGIPATDNFVIVESGF